MTQSEQDTAVTPTQAAASRIRSLRGLRGWNSDELAERMQACGVRWTRSIVANLESGRRPDVTLIELFALAYVFDVSPLSLLFPAEPESYAVTPTDTAGGILRVYDWVVGRAGLPFGEQKPSMAYVGIPAGLPKYLDDRERHLAEEYQRQVNGLLAEVGRLKEQAESKQLKPPEEVVRLVARVESEREEFRREAERERALRERQEKIVRRAAAADETLGPRLVRINQEIQLEEREGGGSGGEGTDSEDRP